MNKIYQIVRLKQVMQRWRRSPGGQIPLEVGPERRRFSIPARFLNLPIIISLLNVAYNEFGYQRDGVLALPSCDEDLFQIIIDLLHKDEKTYGGLEIEDFVNFGIDSFGACKDSATSASCDDGVKPLLNKARA